jgi:hypothetical protein
LPDGKEFKFDKYKGWYDEWGNYYDENGSSSKPPLDYEEDDNFQEVN